MLFALTEDTKYHKSCDFSERFCYLIKRSTCSIWSLNDPPLECAYTNNSALFTYKKLIDNKKYEKNNKTRSTDVLTLELKSLLYFRSICFCADICTFWVVQVGAIVLWETINCSKCHPRGFQTPTEQEAFDCKNTKTNICFTGEIQHTWLFWTPSGTPLSQGTYIFYFLEFQKSRSSGPVLIQTLRGTPKVVYREHKCFKLKILEKGGGGTPPYFALNEGTNIM